MAAVEPNLCLSFAQVVSGQSGLDGPLSPRASAKSFNGISFSGDGATVKKPGIFKGEPAIFFTKDEVEKLANPFRFTLIGKFSYWRPSMDVIRKFFISLGLKSLKNVGLIHENHVVIFISAQEDYSRLLFRSTWFVNGAPMKIFKWCPEFFPHCESPTVPVWLGFPGLPLHFFDKSVLFSIASVFGDPLKTDEPTVNLSRPTVARVCVDMDVSKPRGNRIWLGDEKIGFWQEVVFENPPHYCDFCKKLGHGEDVCFVKNPLLKTQQDKVTVSTNVVEKMKQPLLIRSEKENRTLTWKQKQICVDPVPNSMGVNIGSTKEDEGVWQTQKSKKKKQNRGDENNIANGNKQAVHPVIPLEVQHLGVVQSNKVAEVFVPSPLTEVLPFDLSRKMYLTPFNQNKIPEKLPSVSVREPTSKQKTISDPDISKVDNSQPLISSGSKIQPSIGIEPSLSSKCGALVHLSETRDDRNFQLQTSLGIGKNSATDISLPCSSSMGKFGPLIALDENEIQPWINKELSIQPPLSIDCGSQKLLSGIAIGNQPLISEDLQFMPPISINCGSHKVICDREIAIQPSLLSPPHGGGAQEQFSDTFQPLIGNILQFEPPLSISNGPHNEASGDKIVYEPQHFSQLHGSGSHEFICEEQIQPPLTISNGPHNEAIGDNCSPSSGPILVDNISGPNDFLVTNSLGQIVNLFAGPEHTESVPGQTHSTIPEGHVLSPLPFNQVFPFSLDVPSLDLVDIPSFLFLKKPLFFHFTSSNIVLKSVFKKAFHNFLSLSGSFLKQFSKGVFNWVCIKNCCIQFLKHSKLSVSWRLRRAIEQFFNCVSSSSKEIAPSPSSSSVNKPSPKKILLSSTPSHLGSRGPCMLNEECSVPSSQSQFQPIFDAYVSDSEDPSEDFGEDLFVEEICSKWEKKRKFNRDFPVARRPRLHRQKHKFMPPSTYSSIPEMDSDGYDHPGFVKLSE